MKKILFAFMVGLIPTLALTNEAHAQSSEILASTTPVKNNFKFGGTQISKNSNTVNLDMVNTKALKNFRKKYKVNNEKWVPGEDCVVASYLLDNISHSIYFDKKGNWVASLKVYKEDIMPKDIRKMVRREYYDYKIMLVREIETLETLENGGNPEYLVSIEDENNIKEISIIGYKMDVFKDLKKS